MAAAEPFPRLLRRALVWPFGVFAAAYLLALLGKDSQESKVFGGLWLAATTGAALVELVAK